MAEDSLLEDADDDKHNINVSVVVPIYNGEPWLDECLESLSQQQHNLNVQLSVFLDSCTDNSLDIVEKWRSVLQDIGYSVIITSEENAKPKGVGYAKNKAVNQSSGEFLCFLDADDLMLAGRIEKQYELAYHNRDYIIGSRFTRIPENSTERYTRWANGLTTDQLSSQIYTSHGPTVIMPTWFCHRSVFKRIGGFDEGGRGCPEDLIFFYKHIAVGGKVLRHDDNLLIYRYHHLATTFSISCETIWDLRVKEIQKNVLCKWVNFTIWNAGKQGRKFYRSLSTENQKKVISFCDVDIKKVGSKYTYEYSKDKIKPQVPIIHFKEAHPPIIVCIKMDLTGGIFEENLRSMNMIEGCDYYHFN